MTSGLLIAVTVSTDDVPRPPPPPDTTAHQALAERIRAWLVGDTGIDQTWTIPGTTTLGADLVDGTEFTITTERGAADQWGKERRPAPPRKHRGPAEGGTGRCRQARAREYPHRDAPGAPAPYRMLGMHGPPASGASQGSAGPHLVDLGPAHRAPEIRLGGIQSAGIWVQRGERHGLVTPRESGAQRGESVATADSTRR